MSSLEKRAWLALWSMCPLYLVYFALQAAAPVWLATMPARIACLAVVAGVHAVAYVGGLLAIKYRERGEPLLQDQRDHAIDGRATRSAYFALMAGLIVVGVVMPFGGSGWKLVNAGLFFIVASETLRYLLIVLGYRRAPRLAR